MKLSAWAKQRGIKYRTAWLWVKYGKMPVPFERTPTGTILVQDPTQTCDELNIEHRDRLTRFGSEYLEENMRASERKLLIAETAEVADDLVQDMIEVLTSFRARLYGRRSAKKRAQLAVKAIQASA